MKQSTLYGLLLLSFTFTVLAAPGGRGLELTYSHNASVCNKAKRILSSDPSCRPFDEGTCGTSAASGMGADPGGSYEELAVNEYGFTQIVRPGIRARDGVAIVYVQEFQGDSHPRLIETWKVGADDLTQILALPPGPMIGKNGSQIRVPKNTNADAFSKLLAHGQKISDEWSPVVMIEGNPYLFVRECDAASAGWDYGLYTCGKVTKLTVFDVNPHQPTVQCRLDKRNKTKSSGSK
ncbi:hypothetical protein [Rhodanobacter glycinis]|uniref:hypothetical protein n=1 Tax=Rhodanobacter glycinis TaxID=582702 RepID=UPI00112C5762|nr:hypothetical protein [Rhodanobacter glycinis]